MKKIIVLICVVFNSATLTFSQCDLKLKDQVVNKSKSEGHQYLKDFTFELKEQDSEIKYSMILNAKTDYRFYLGISDKYPSEAEFKVFDRNTKETRKLQVSKGINFLDITPETSGTFDLIIKIVKGTKSCGVIILSVSNNKMKIVNSPNSHEDTSISVTKTYIIVDEMPEFVIGDDMSFRKWVAQNLKYPEAAEKKGIQGKAFVQFVVNKEGKMQNIKVIRGIDPEIDSYLVKFLKTCPSWQKPGKIKGKAVDVSFTFPINLALQKKNNK